MARCVLSGPLLHTIRASQCRQFTVDHKEMSKCVCLQPLNDPPWPRNDKSPQFRPCIKTIYSWCYYESLFRFSGFFPPQMHLLEVSHQMKVQHVVCQQISLPVMQVCPDRNSVNQPEAADDDIPASPSQVMNGSVKSRALAQEVCWAFSHVAANKRQFG